MKARNSGEITWFPKNWCESWISSWSFPLLKHWLFLPQLCAIIIDTENYQAKIFLKVWVSSLTKLFVSTNVLKRTVCVRGEGYKHSIKPLLIVCILLSTTARCMLSLNSYCYSDKQWHVYFHIFFCSNDFYWNLVSESQGLCFHFFLVILAQ